MEIEADEDEPEGELAAAAALMQGLEQPPPPPPRTSTFLVEEKHRGAAGQPPLPPAPAPPPPALAAEEQQQPQQQCALVRDDPLYTTAPAALTTASLLAAGAPADDPMALVSQALTTAAQPSPCGPRSSGGGAARAPARPPVLSLSSPTLQPRLAMPLSASAAGCSATATAATPATPGVSRPSTGDSGDGVDGGVAIAAAMEDGGAAEPPSAFARACGQAADALMSPAPAVPCGLLAASPTPTPAAAAASQPRAVPRALSLPARGGALGPGPMDEGLTPPPGDHHHHHHHAHHLSLEDGEGQQGGAGSPAPQHALQHAHSALAMLQPPRVYGVGRFSVVELFGPPPTPSGQLLPPSGGVTPSASGQLSHATDAALQPKASWAAHHAGTQPSPGPTSGSKPFEAQPAAMEEGAPAAAAAASSRAFAHHLSMPHHHAAQHAQQRREHSAPPPACDAPPAAPPLPHHDGVAAPRPAHLPSPLQLPDGPAPQPVRVGRFTVVTTAGGAGADATTHLPSPAAPAAAVPVPGGHSHHAVRLDHRHSCSAPLFGAADTNHDAPSPSPSPSPSPPSSAACLAAAAVPLPAGRRPSGGDATPAQQPLAACAGTAAAAAGGGLVVAVHETRRGRFRVTEESLVLPSAALAPAAAAGDAVDA